MTRRNRAGQQNRVKHVTSVMKRNLYVVFFVILVLCVALIIRLAYINYADGDKYTKAVLSQQSYSSSTIPAVRGSIVDRNGVVLARSETKYNVIIDARVILSKDYYLNPTLETLSAVLGYDSDEIKKLISNNPDSAYIVYEKDIPYEKVSEFKTYEGSHKFVEGVWFEEEESRSYPHGSLASHVVGFTTRDGQGTYGLEQYYNDELTGTDGLKYGYFDAELNAESNTVDAIDGCDIVSTIDFNIQEVIERKVADFIETTGCNNIGVIVMDPDNGEIYGMASNREYDLNNPRDLTGLYSEEELSLMDDSEKLDALYSTWRNFCVSDTYEPGSTFKTITVASALEEDAIMTTDTFGCEGYTEVGGWKISCNNKYGHGTISLAEALMKSCNCALMTIASKLGPNGFYNYQRMFGFGAKTGIDITGESSGIIIDMSNLRETELATSSFGTTFNVTMVQMAAAYSSIINGGTYYTPHLVKRVMNSDGSVASEFDCRAVKQTVSESTSRFIRNSLYLTVESGTATPAKVEGYLIGGKTGTAQKRPKEEKKYVVSFAGFAPVNDPEVLVYIVIDEVHDEALNGSSSPATRMSAEIMKEILPYLGMYPEGDIEYFVDYDLIAEIDNDRYDPSQDEMNPDVLPVDYDE